MVAIRSPAGRSVGMGGSGCEKGANGVHGYSHHHEMGHHRIVEGSKLIIHQKDVLP